MLFKFFMRIQDKKDKIHNEYQNTLKCDKETSFYKEAFFKTPNNAFNPFKGSFI